VIATGTEPAVVCAVTVLPAIRGNGFRVLCACGATMTRPTKRMAEETGADHVQRMAARRRRPDVITK
jgi:hypothetical protein